jgi:uncharacterized protein
VADDLPAKFEWDPAKARANARKHGIAFSLAASAFSDPFALTMLDPDPDEDRFTLLASEPLGRVLVVVFTVRGERIRIISARKANAIERKVYAERRR